MTNHRIAKYGLFVALAMILSYVEAALPSIAIPGVKLGLANLVGMVALFHMGWKDAVIITLIRIVFTGITFGNPFSMCYSLGGAALSLLSMCLLKKTGGFSAVGISIAGGIMHNVGQLIFAAFVLQSASVFTYLPVLLMSGTIAGIAIGLLTGLVIKRLPK